VQLQELAGEGNTGSVSIDGESVVPGNTHSDDGEWNRISRKRKKSKSSEASTSASGTGTGNAKKGRVDSGLLNGELIKKFYSLFIEV